VITRIFSVALFAGLLAGLLVAVLQQAVTSPLIVAAEAYEAPADTAAPGAAAPHDHAGHDHGAPAASAAAGDHHHDDDAWMPAEGAERIAATAVATLATAVGFAMMLLAVMVASGRAITPASATAFGIAGFIAVHLAPALGLAPELPGAAAAALEARQLWWVATVAATAAGLWLIALRPHTLAKVAGLALVVAPHVVGAPHPHDYASAVPAELAGEFAARSLALAAVLWIAIGAFTGWFWQRGETTGTVPA